ncbi:AMP-binding protein, partial [Streptomyces sp. NPDC021218]|uniref:AMP-binding protein n=1 Tax=Streptomyces sp. NPDC021218 TaxID=3365119 RepID=UPI00378F05B1
LVEAQAARTPDAVAVVCGEEQLTYAQLNTRANRIAGRLRLMGLDRGARVGLCLERSPELVAGLLGVLKAGGAYVPLDPDYPPKRLQFMLEDAGIEVVLSHAQAIERVPLGPTVIALDDTKQVGCTELVATNAGPDDIAYVIYTSGTTGKPKGVPNTHRGILNRLLWGQTEFPLSASDRVIQKTPYSFDVSVWEFLWPLLAGARLIMAKPGGHRDPAYLSCLIRDEQVTTLHFVPSMLREFLDAIDPRTLPSLRRVFCSGEALPTELARRFCGSEMACTLHNLYGPTEAAIEVSRGDYRADETRTFVPIGGPIANTEVFVMDRFGGLAPVGVPGELWIG